MGTSVYVASVEGFTGKSTVALGVLEQLSRRVERVGVFRPIVRADAERYGGRDYVLDLLTAHDSVSLSYDECAGVSYDEVHEDPAEALDRIVERYHRVADKCDAVVIVGSDYTDIGTPTEFSYNARIAANLGAPVLLVLNGAGVRVHELTLRTPTLDDVFLSATGGRLPGNRVAAVGRHARHRKLLRYRRCDAHVGRRMALAGHPVWFYQDAPYIFPDPGPRVPADTAIKAAMRMRGRIRGVEDVAIDRAAKEQVLACYFSQITALFGDMVQYRELASAHYASLGGDIERFHVLSW